MFRSIFFICSTLLGNQLTAQARISVEWVWQAPGKRFHHAQLTLNASSSRLPAQGWSLYFNSILRIRPFADQVPLTLKFINGDLYRIQPKPEFKGLKPGDTLSIKLDYPNAVLNYSLAPDGFYIDLNGNQTSLDRHIKPFPPQHMKRAPDDRIPLDTPTHRYQLNQSRIPAMSAPPLLPSPAEINIKPGRFGLPANPIIAHDLPSTEKATWLRDQLRIRLNVKASLQAAHRSSRASIRLAILPSDPSPPADAYQITVNRAGVRITAQDQAGLFYGVQSFFNLIPAKAYAGRQSITLPHLIINDHPRFPYRGMHLDVARNFQNKAAVLKLLDIMAAYKLNRFHFHLTDDEGWRLEIPGLPELTQVGARRQHLDPDDPTLFPSLGSGPDDSSMGSGFYTRADYIEILRYATERHIQVIPEIDMPGHARAAIVSMKVRYQRLMAEGNEEEAQRYMLHDPDDASEYRSVQRWKDNVICAGRESAYTFMTKVIDEIRAMHLEADAPLQIIHAGGDETPEGVWKKSPVAAAYMKKHQIKETTELFHHFFHRVADILDRRGLTLGGWQEVALKGPEKKPDPNLALRGVISYMWHNVPGWGSEDVAHKLANAGMKVVLTPAANLYFDLAYNKHGQEPGLYWAGWVDTRKAFEFSPTNPFAAGMFNHFGHSLRTDYYQNKIQLKPEATSFVLGIQGQLWSETVRKPELLEYKIFPKLLGLAERAWAPESTFESMAPSSAREKALEQAWSKFATRLGLEELPRLNYLFGGVGYRVPPPGAIIQDSQLHANLPYPGFTIRYTTDGSDPNQSDKKWTEPVMVDGLVKLRAFTSNGRASRVVELTPQQ